MNIPANRVVAVLTPAVFAPLAGAISVFAAKKANMDIDANQLTALFITGATIAFGKSALWMKGWQEYEKGQQMPADALVAADDVSALSEDELAGEDELPGEDEVALGEAVAEAEGEVADELGEFDEPAIEGDEEPDFHDEAVVADGHVVLNGVNG